MPLFATTALTGPNGEQIIPDQRIPASWPVDDPFVVECIQLGFIENRDDEGTTPLPATGPVVPVPADATGPERRGNRPPAADPYDVPIEVGGIATQAHTDSGEDA